MPGAQCAVSAARTARQAVIKLAVTMGRATMDRRRFMRLAAFGAGALAVVPLLEACGQSAAPPAAPAATARPAAPATSAPQPTMAAAASGAAPSSGAAP